MLFAPRLVVYKEITGLHSIRLLRIEMTATRRRRTMEALIASALPIAAVGYSLVYLLAGGGLGGAILIFIVAKLLGR
jgi:hypothetical protein